jgi:cytidylate kinase
MERMKLNEENAKKEIKDSDSNHYEFTRRYFHAETEDPLDYDLVINTKRITLEEATSIIVNAIPFEKRNKGQTTHGNASPNLR